MVTSEVEYCRFLGVPSEMQKLKMQKLDIVQKKSIFFHKRKVFSYHQIAQCDVWGYINAYRV